MSRWSGRHGAPPRPCRAGSAGRSPAPSPAGPWLLPASSSRSPHARHAPEGSPDCQPLSSDGGRTADVGAVSRRRRRIRTRSNARGRTTRFQPPSAAALGTTAPSTPSSAAARATRRASRFGASGDHGPVSPGKPTRSARRVAGSSQVQHGQVHVELADPARVVIWPAWRVAGVRPFGPHGVALQRGVERPRIARTVVAAGMRRGLLGGRQPGTRIAVWPARPRRRLTGARVRRLRSGPRRHRRARRCVHGRTGSQQLHLGRRQPRCALRPVTRLSRPRRHLGPQDLQHGRRVVQLQPVLSAARPHARSPALHRPRAGAGRLRYHAGRQPQGTTRTHCHVMMLSPVKLSVKLSV